jgi:hypothetical protein
VWQRCTVRVGLPGYICCLHMGIMTICQVPYANPCGFVNGKTHHVTAGSGCSHTVCLEEKKFLDWFGHLKSGFVR